MADGRLINASNSSIPGDDTDTDAPNDATQSSSAGDQPLTIPNAQSTALNNAAPDAAPLIIVEYDPTALEEPAENSEDEDEELEGMEADEDEGGDGGGSDGEEDVEEGRMWTTVAPKRGYRSKADRAAVKGGKRGNPGRFHGAAFEYLTAGLEDYKLANRPGRGKVKRLKVFFFNLFGAFWEKFDWKEFAEPHHNGNQAKVIQDTNAVSFIPTRSWRLNLLIVRYSPFRHGTGTAPKPSRRRM